MTSPRVVLVGMPGAGKTTVGRALAARLGVPFADTDDLVYRDTGRSVTDLFAESEAAFRVAEARSVITALHEFPGVLALGGGSLTTPAVRKALRDAPVVCLHANVGTLVERVERVDRVGRAVDRPLLAGQPAERLAVLWAEREALFEAYPNVLTDSLDVEMVVQQVLEYVAVPS